MRGIKLLLSVVVPALLLAGCSWSDTVFSPHGKIRGAWVYDDASYGKPVLVFRKDRTYQIDLTGDGTYEIYGTYEFTDKHLRLRSEQGSFSKLDCRDGGFYGQTVKGDYLTFEYYVDQCKERTAFLEHTWIRKEIRDEENRQKALEAQRKMEMEQRQAEVEARRKAAEERRQKVKRGEKVKKKKVKVDDKEDDYYPSTVNFTHR